MDDLEQYLKDVMADMNKSWHHYKDLRPKDKAIVTQPIPFFGDIMSARVLTVGVNPSATEFRPLRWPDQVPLDYLKNRLIGYFASEQVKPDDWFNTWTEALEHLGTSYQVGAAYLAAHLDLSPRVTRSMGSVDPYDFLTMVKADAKWFFELVLRCKTVRLMLMSGTVTKCYYMNDFIKRIALTHGLQFEGTLNEKTGKSKTGYYHLRGPGIDLPCFFCSVSPSDKRLDENKKERRLMLVQRVEEHKEKLLELMNERPACSNS